LQLANIIGWVWLTLRRTSFWRRCGNNQTGSVFDFFEHLVMSRFMNILGRPAIGN
jgi:hypothetical protein